MVKNNLYKNVIIEGVDCVGKSTLIKELNKNFYFKKIKRSAPKNFNSGLRAIEKDFELLNNNTGLLFDRSVLIGEYIYGNYLRKYNEKYTDELKKFADFNVDIIILYDDYKKIEKRFDNIFIKKSDIKKLQYNYLKMYNKIKKYGNKRIYFVNVNNIKKIIEIFLL